MASLSGFSKLKNYHVLEKLVTDFESFLTTIDKVSGKSSIYFLVLLVCRCDSGQINKTR